MREQIRSVIMMAGLARVAIVALVASTCACGSSANNNVDAAMGSEQQACYGNHTCNAGLTCLSNLCVAVTRNEREGGTALAGAGGMALDAASAERSYAEAAVPPDVGAEPPPDADVSFGGINADWYTVNDCVMSPFDCTKGGNEPPRHFDGTPFCTKGTVPAFHGANWGSAIALAFRPDTFDAVAAGVTGFSFDLTGQSPSAATVQVLSKSPSLGIHPTSEYGDAAIGGHTVVLLSELKPLFVPPPADPSKLISVDWAVFETTAPIAFDYCVANFALVKQ